MYPTPRVRNRLASQTGYQRFKQYCEGDPFCTDSGFVTFLIAEQAMIDARAPPSE